MLSEDLKKQFLSSRDYYTAKRWEGKPLFYKFKFALANYPEFVISSFMFIFVLPPLAVYKYYSLKDSKREALTKYKSMYTVVRDDHPQIEEILKEREKIRHHFPQK